MSNRLLGVVETRGDFLQRERTNASYLAQDRQHVDVSRAAMTGETRFDHAFPHPCPAAAEHERYFVERCATQVEREDPCFLLLAIQARCPRSLCSPGGGVGAAD